MNTPQITLDDIYFVSAQHIRYENDFFETDQSHSPRAIKVEPNIIGSTGFTVTMYNLETKSVQMASKQMKIVKFTDDSVHLIGFGSDRFGSPFSDYGLDIYTENSNPLVPQTEIKYMILELFDRDIYIKYLPLKSDNIFKVNYNVQTSSFHQIPDMRMDFKQDLVKYFFAYNLNNEVVLLKDIAQITSFYAITLFDSYIKNANNALVSLLKTNKTILPISIVKSVKEQLYDVTKILIPEMKSLEAKKLLNDSIDEKIFTENIITIAQSYLEKVKINI